VARVTFFDPMVVDSGRDDASSTSSLESHPACLSEEEQEEDSESRTCSSVRTRPNGKNSEESRQHPRDYNIKNVDAENDEDNDDDTTTDGSTRTAVHTIEIEFELEDDGGHPASLWDDTSIADGNLCSSHGDVISNMVEFQHSAALQRNIYTTASASSTPPNATQSTSDSVENQARYGSHSRSLDIQSNARHHHIQEKQEPATPPSFNPPHWGAMKAPSTILPSKQYPSLDAAKEAKDGETNFQVVSVVKNVAPRAASEGDPARAKLQFKLAQALDKVDHLVATHQKDRNEWQSSMIKLARIEREYTTALSEGRSWAKLFNQQCDTVSEQEIQLQSLRSNAGRVISGGDEANSLQREADETKAKLNKAQLRIRILELEVVNARTNHAMDLEAAQTQMWNLSEQLHEAKETTRRLSYHNNNNNNKGEQQQRQPEGAARREDKDVLLLQLPLGKSTLKENIDPIRSKQSQRVAAKQRKSLLHLPVGGFKSILEPRERHQALLKGALQQQRIQALEATESALENKQTGEMDQLKEAIHVLVQQTNSLQSEMNGHIMDKGKLEREVEILKVEQDRLLKNTHTIVCELAACGRREALAAQVTLEAEQCVQKLTTELLDTHTALCSVTHEKERVEADLTMLQALCGQLEGEFYDISKEREVLRDRVGFQAKTISGLQGQICFLEQEATRRDALAQEQIEELRNEAGTSKRALIDVLSRMDTLDKFLDEQIAENEKQKQLTTHREKMLAEELALLRAHVQTLEADKSRMCQEQAVLMSQLEQRHRNESLLQDQVGMLELTAKATTMELDQSKQNNERLEWKIHGMIDRWRITTAEFQGQLAECHAKECLLVQEKQDLESLAELATEELEQEQERSLEMAKEMDKWQVTANRLEGLARLLADETKKERETHRLGVGKLQAVIEKMEDEAAKIKLNSVTEIENLTRQLESEQHRWNQAQQEICHLKLNFVVMCKANDQLSRSKHAQHKKHVQQLKNQTVDSQQHICRLHLNSSILLSKANEQLAQAHVKACRLKVNASILSKTNALVSDENQRLQALHAKEMARVNQKLDHTSNVLVEARATEVESLQTICRQRVNAAILLNQMGAQLVQAHKDNCRFSLNNAILNKSKLQLLHEKEAQRKKYAMEYNDVIHILEQVKADVRTLSCREVQARQSICRLKVSTAVIHHTTNRQHVQAQKDMARMTINCAVLRHKNTQISTKKQKLDLYVDELNTKLVQATHDLDMQDERHTMQCAALTKELEQLRFELHQSRLLEAELNQKLLQALQDLEATHNLEERRLLHCAALTEEVEQSFQDLNQSRVLEADLNQKLSRALHDLETARNLEERRLLQCEALTEEVEQSFQDLNQSRFLEAVLNQQLSHAVHDLETARNLDERRLLQCAALTEELELSRHALDQSCILEAELNRKLEQALRELEKVRILEVKAQQSISRGRLNIAVLRHLTKQHQAQSEAEICHLKRNTAILSQACVKATKCNQDLEERHMLQLAEFTQELKQSRHDLDQSNLLEIQAQFRISRLQKNVDLLSATNEQLSKENQNLQEKHMVQIEEVTESWHCLEKRLADEINSWKLQAKLAKEQALSAHQKMFNLEQELLKANRSASEVERDRQNKQAAAFDILQSLDGLLLP
jgi:hypothetical protein